MTKTEQIIQQLWDNYKRCNLHVIGTPERKDSEKETEEIFRVIMAQKFPKLMKH